MGKTTLSGRRVRARKRPVPRGIAERASSCHVSASGEYPTLKTALTYTSIMAARLPEPLRTVNRKLNRSENLAAYQRPPQGVAVIRRGRRSGQHACPHSRGHGRKHPAMSDAVRSPYQIRRQIKKPVPVGGPGRADAPPLDCGYENQQRHLASRISWIGTADDCCVTHICEEWMTA